jgi:hypothetical protein
MEECGDHARITGLLFRRSCLAGQMLSWRVPEACAHLLSLISFAKLDSVQRRMPEQTLGQVPSTEDRQPPTIQC